jgi:hypothetical protein
MNWPLTILIAAILAFVWTMVATHSKHDEPLPRWPLAHESRIA